MIPGHIITPSDEEQRWRTVKGIYDALERGDETYELDRNAMRDLVNFHKDDSQPLRSWNVELLARVGDLAGRVFQTVKCAAIKKGITEFNQLTRNIVKRLNTGLRLQGLSVPVPNDLLVEFTEEEPSDVPKTNKENDKPLFEALKDCLKDLNKNMNEARKPLTVDTVHLVARLTLMRNSLFHGRAGTTKRKLHGVQPKGELKKVLDEELELLNKDWIEWKEYTVRMADFYYDFACWNENENDAENTPPNST
ncbi:uncharacterized protein BDV14DRAFT_199669 [Aspergillus stella-maris]|uniref:uncharacterized protein n=1 Tax=Aspergillus stella-maris TaxID=1810926 RepID=UPI003CCDACEC